MKKNIINTALLSIISIFASCNIINAQQSENALQKVIIIRHGEKPETGNNLSCQGFNRAIQLPEVLYSKFKLPDYIFVPSFKTGKETTQSRMYQTIVPFAVKYNLNIDTRFNVKDASSVSNAVLKKKGTVLIIWEHNAIPAIVKGLGIKEEVKWKGEDFDSIWIITFVNGKATLNKDKENINPATACK